VLHFKCVHGVAIHSVLNRIW